MKPFPRALAAAAAAGALTAGLAAGAGAAGAATPARPHVAPGGTVFVQNDNLSGNQVVAYDRAADGTLTQAGVYDTGGLGGQLAGSAVDHLASQGSLAHSADGSTLYAVNAGSDTVSVFAVRGDRLSLRQVVGSGGDFPVSIAVHGDLVYVLNGLGGGSLQGYVAFAGRLFPLPGSQHALGLDPTATPQFTNTPGQVAFTPDGRQLVVTTKANGSDIDVFGVSRWGWLSAAPVVNAEPGTVPFAVSFDPSGHLVIAEAGTNALSTWALAGDGTATLIDRTPDGQAATCWVVGIGNLFYASNAGSASLSGYQADGAGNLALLGNSATDAGTVDAAAAPGGQFLYVQTGAHGIVDEFQVGAGGALTEVGSVTVPAGQGGEGIVAL